MSVDTWDCESPSVDRTTRHRAKKEWKCCACRGPILRGELYTYSFMVFDGDADERRRCARCDAIYEHLCALHTGGEDWPAWDLNCGHSYQERWEKDPPPEIARLAFMTSAEVLAEGTPNPPMSRKVLT